MAFVFDPVRIVVSKTVTTCSILSWHVSITFLPQYSVYDSSSLILLLLFLLQLHYERLFKYIENFTIKK